MRKYKWGILAPGNISIKFAKGLKVIPEAELYAVGSRDLGRAQAFADEYGFAKAYGSYKELAEDADVDIIYVATPHPQHEEATILCLENGKAVLCEKPFAANKAQTQRMIDCAIKNKVFLMEAMWSRFLPTFNKVYELIADGAIGNVNHITADFCFRTDVNPQSRLFAPELAGGSLLDIGVYNIALCSDIFGKKPDKIQSYMDIGTTGVDEKASVMFNYIGGQSALLLSAIRVSTTHEAAIYGDAGYIKLPVYWCGSKLILNNKDGTQEFDLPYEATGYQFEAIEAMECLEKGLLESPRMTLKETLEIMETLDQIRADNNLKYPFE